MHPGVKRCLRLRPLPGQDLQPVPHFACRRIGGHAAADGPCPTTSSRAGRTALPTSRTRTASATPLPGNEPPDEAEDHLRVGRLLVPRREQPGRQAADHDQPLVRQEAERFAGDLDVLVATGAADGEEEAGVEVGDGHLRAGGVQRNGRREEGRVDAVDASDLTRACTAVEFTR